MVRITLLNMLTFGRDICSHYPEACHKEWLLSNGLGGYASGTICGANVRRYHALLVSALKPPANRYVLINRLDETLRYRDKTIDLTCQRYPNALLSGHLFLEQFTLDPFPKFTYQCDEIRLEKIIFLKHGQDAVVVLYRLLSGQEATLRIRPLMSFRNHHTLSKDHSRFQDAVERIPKGLRVFVPDVAELFLTSSAMSVQADPLWYQDVEYDQERLRGLDYQEDLFSPGFFEVTLHEDDPSSGFGGAWWAASRGQIPEGHGRSWFLEEQAKLDQRTTKRSWKSSLARTLAVAADQFAVRRNAGASIVAGYPWFEEWSRDTMISLPGLLLATGRTLEAQEVLQEFSQYIEDGILLNRFPENGGMPEYNNVDAALWFLWAVQNYYQATKDQAFVQKIYPKLKEVIQCYRRGTRHGIRMDSDGLIISGDPEIALTWMDAKIGDWVVTPRAGKPVEIQALWYNGLRFLEKISQDFGDKLSATYGEIAALTKSSFNKMFWNNAHDYLFDAISSQGPDNSIRPNALYAISLPEPVLEERRFQPVVNTAWKELYTSYGLRSLSLRDKNYTGIYQGGPSERDAAYHQGTAWSYLLGAFISAYLKAYGRNSRTLAQTRAFLEPLETHLQDAGIGTVSEIFDGDAPYHPRGCPAQAWGVAEILRVIWQERLEQ